MKKRMRFGGMIFLLSVVLVGCQQPDRSVDVKEEIKEVTMFASTEFKQEHSDANCSSTETDNPEIIETVKNILNEATKQAGIVDMVEPNYYVEIVYTDNRTK